MVYIKKYWHIFRICWGQIQSGVQSLTMKIAWLQCKQLNMQATNHIKFISTIRFKNQLHVKLISPEMSQEPWLQHCSSKKTPNAVNLAHFEVYAYLYILEHSFE